MISNRYILEFFINDCVCICIIFVYKNGRWILFYFIVYNIVRDRKKDVLVFVNLIDD